MSYCIQYQELATYDPTWYSLKESYPGQDEAMRAIDDLMARGGRWAQRAYRVGPHQKVEITHPELVRLADQLRAQGVVAALWFGEDGAEAVLSDEDAIAAAVPGAPVRRGWLLGRRIQDVVRGLLASDRQAAAQEREREAALEAYQRAEAEEHERAVQQERERVAVFKAQLAAQERERERVAKEARERAAALEAKQRAEAQERAAAQERERIAKEARERAAMLEAKQRAEAQERQRLAQQERERTMALEAKQRAEAQERELVAHQERARAALEAQHRAVQERDWPAQQERDHAAREAQQRAVRERDRTTALEAQRTGQERERERVAKQERGRAASPERQGRLPPVRFIPLASVQRRVAAVDPPVSTARVTEATKLGGDRDLGALATLLRCGPWREGMRASDLLTTEQLPAGAHRALQELVGKAAFTVRALGNALKRVQDKRVEGIPRKVTRTIDHHGFALWQVVNDRDETSTAPDHPSNATLLRGALTGMGYGAAEATYAVSVLRARLDTEPLATLVREALAVLARRPVPGAKSR